MQLLEYYGLKEKETPAFTELQNRLKISDVEAKVFSLKNKALQTENNRLEAQLADYMRVATELEAAKVKIKEQRVLMLKLQEQLQDPSETVDPDLPEKLQRVEDLESEREELRKSNYELQWENSELARRLESTQLLATSLLEDLEEVKDGHQVTRSTPSLPPPLPPFHHHFEPPSTRRILDSQGAKSIEEIFVIQGTVVEKEVQGDMHSECEKTQDGLQDLIVPSSEIETFLKGILFILGKSNEFEKDKLIQLWMAGGFIKNEPMEVIGVKYFEKLVVEGYILCLNANSLYKVNIEKLDIELDMIIEKSNCLRLKSTNQNSAASTDILHVSVIGDEMDETIFKALGRFNRLRTLLFLGNYGSRMQQVPRDLFPSLEVLQALDLSGTHIKELPSSVEKMIHLRYLDLSWTFIELLPEGIAGFEKLQTLKLKGCSRLQRLPEEMKRLTELRHLDLDVLGQLTAFPEGIGALVKLRTLSAFLVGTEEGFKISELKYLNSLTGEFCIADLENVQSANEAKEASLVVKTNIKKLELRWTDYECEEPKTEDESILENLCPCSDLEEIQIVYYHGTKLPTWIAAVSFRNLFSVVLFKCEHVCVLPSFEKLPSLQTLELMSLNSVTKMDFRGKVDQVAFPELKKLVVDEMLNLETWREAEEGDFPCLVELNIKDCPKVPEIPSLVHLSSIKYLEVSGCTKLAFFSEKKLSSSLQKLIVEDCPLIEERCSEQGGQDWHKIQHVPMIWIDQVAIQSYEDDSEVDTEGSYW